MYCCLLACPVGNVKAAQTKMLAILFFRVAERLQKKAVKFDEIDGVGWQSARKLNIGSTAKNRRTSMAAEVQQKHGL